MTNPTPPMPVHGGDIDNAVKCFGVPRHQWLDLSTGINPRPYPVSAGFLENEHWTRLPGRQALAALKDAAARHYGTPSETIVSAPGSQSLIGLLANTTAPTCVAVVEPTYSEHALGWQAAGHDVTAVPSIEDMPARATHLILCNPNNPDGHQTTPERIIAMAKTLQARGGAVIVDEAFGDVAPAISVAAQCTEPGLVVLRSFGKFFGLAGVRLGFALSAPARVHALETALGPWAVGGPTLAIGGAALDDVNWIADTRLWLEEQARALDGVLVDGGLNVIGGTDLFRLTEAPAGDAQALAQKLGEAGILVRTFADHPAWVRFGLPGTVANLDRLAAALT